jgi:hypothetical protein
VGTGDPNCWLHEAVALATEAAVNPQKCSWYPWLWEWSTKPERSFEAHTSGSLAAPFVAFLMNVLGRQFGAELYRMSTETVPAMHGTVLLAHWWEQHAKRPLAFASDFPALFVEYCVDAGLLGVVPKRTLDPAIADLVGVRVRTEIFHRYPVHAAARNASLEHLGCRYFEFHPTAVDSQLVMRVTARENCARRMLRGVLVAISPDRSVKQCLTLSTSGEGCLETTLPQFSKRNVDHALLVLVNCGYGEGWAEWDDLQFEIHARIEH